MRNITKFRSRSASNTANQDNMKSMRTYRGGGGKVQRLKTKNIADGAYKIRFFPEHPEKCPDGFLHLITHNIEPTPGARFQDCHQILASKCYDNQNLAPRYLDDVLAAMQDIIQPQFDHLSADLQNYISMMIPEEKLYIPTLFWADHRIDVTTENGKEKKTLVITGSNPNCKEPVGAILEIIFAKALIERIFTLFGQYANKSPNPDFDLLEEESDENPRELSFSYLADPNVGHNLLFTKTGYKYVLDAEPQPSLWPAVCDSLRAADYPNLSNWTKNMRKTDTEIYRLLTDSWGCEEIAKIKCPQTGDTVDFSL